MDLEFLQISSASSKLLFPWVFLSFLAHFLLFLFHFKGGGWINWFFSSLSFVSICTSLNIFTFYLSTLSACRRRPNIIELETDYDDLMKEVHPPPRYLDEVEAALFNLVSGILVEIRTSHFWMEEFPFFFVFPFFEWDYLLHVPSPPSFPGLVHNQRPRKTHSFKRDPFYYLRESVLLISSSFPHSLIFFFAAGPKDDPAVWQPIPAR
jgi:hypothetical protein